MVDINDNPETVFYTYKDIKENNPQWSDRMIEDYMSLKRDVATITENTASNLDDNENINADLISKAGRLRGLINSTINRLSNSDNLISYLIGEVGRVRGLVNSGFIKWRNAWKQVAYHKNDMVTDDGFTMIANKDTFDRAAPQPVGNQSFLLPDTPSWSPQSDVATIYTSMRLFDLSVAYQITSIRVWVPDISSSAHYLVVVTDNLTGVINIGNVFDGSLAPSIGWLEVNIDPVFILPGSDVTFTLISQNSSSTTNYNYPWNYTGQSTPNNDPGTGNNNNNNLNNIIRISATDQNSIDRTVDLDQVIPGTIIKVVSDADANAFFEYEVVNKINNTSWFHYDVALINTGISGAPAIGDVEIFFVVPTPLATDYVSLSNQWVSNPSIQGILRLDDNPEVSSNDAYGIDVKAQEYSASDDWDIVAFNGGSSSVSDAVNDSALGIAYLLGETGRLRGLLNLSNKITGNLNQLIAGLLIDVGKLRSSKADIKQPAWTVPTLSNSWVNFGLGRTDVLYYKDTSGTVHIVGSIKDGTVGSPIFTLPVGFRPLNTQYIPASDDVGALYLDVDSSGNVTLPFGSNTFVYFSGTVRAEQ